MKKISIYVIQNLINLKIYVGQTIHFKTRWGVHKRSAKYVWLEKRKLGDSGIQVIHCAMAKYGIENFSYTILEEWETQNEADEAEEFWICFFRSRDPTYGYNLIPGGRKGVGRGPAHPNYGKPAHNRLFTHTEELAICKRYSEEKLSITELAQEYDCEQSTIHKMLQRHGVKILGNKVLSKGRHYSPGTEFKKGQKAHNRLFTDKQESEICEMYQEGFSCPQIAKLYGCNRSIIQRMLARHSITIRGGSKLTYEQKENIKEEFKTTSSLKLAAKYNVNKSTILRICNSR